MYSELLNRRFIALLIVSFFSSFVSAPLNTLLPVYVEADLLGTPLFSGGLRAAFLILGGVFAVPAGRLADTWGVKPVYVLGTVGPILAGVIFSSGDPLLLTALCTGIGISSGFNSAGGQSYLISAASSSVIGIASAGYFLGNTLGAASGNLLSGPIADIFGFQTLGFCITLAGVVLVLMSILTLPAIPSPKTADNGRNLSAFIQMFRRLDVCLLLGIRYLPTSYWGAVTLLLPLLIFRIAGTSTAATNYSAIGPHRSALRPHRTLASHPRIRVARRHQRPRPRPDRAHPYWHLCLWHSRNRLRVVSFDHHAGPHTIDRPRRRKRPRRWRSPSRLEPGHALWQPRRRKTHRLGSHLALWHLGLILPRRPCLRCGPLSPAWKKRKPIKLRNHHE
ncbi:MAG: MFS transporter [Candidatus Latescibacteria bacterium]|nr:MFS transporter [Candidatus Latescibacterota bacterium]